MRKPGVRTKMHQMTMQHMQKENRRKPSVFAGFLAGAEGLEPSARGFGDRCSTNWAIPLCEILLDYSIIFQSGCQWVFQIFLRVSKNRGECCFSSYLAVSAKNTVLFGEVQPSAKEWNPLNRRSTMKKHSVSVYLSPEISGSYGKNGPNPTEIPRAAMGKLAL